MADIYLHDIREADLELFHQAVIRRYLFEQGIIPPRQRISELRNEMIRAYIKSIADDERELTAAFGIDPNAVNEDGELEVMTDRLARKKINTWIIPQESEIVVVVPAGEADETQGTLDRLALANRRIY